ncbi:MAG: hypothetical protein FWD48_09050 [Oscillospiraceae bacterium]|nr:hypothetical protein [Oscillospiraceae bacterium]
MMKVRPPTVATTSIARKPRTKVARVVQLLHLGGALQGDKWGVKQRRHVIYTGGRI